MTIQDTEKYTPEPDINNSEPEVKGNLYWRIPSVQGKRDMTEVFAKSVRFALGKYKSSFPEYFDRKGPNAMSDADVTRHFLNRFLSNWDDMGLIALISNVNIRPDDVNGNERFDDYFCIRIADHPNFDVLPDTVSLCIIGSCLRGASTPFMQVRRAAITFGQYWPAPYEVMADISFRPLEHGEFPDKYNNDDKNDNILLKDRILNLPAFALKNASNFSSWNNFLDFKENLIKHQAIGLRYISWNYDVQSHQVRFLTVARDRAAMAHVLAGLNRQSINVYTTEVSTDQMVFRLQPVAEGENDRRQENRNRPAFNDLGQLPYGRVEIVELAKGPRYGGAGGKGGNAAVTHEMIDAARSRIQSIASSSGINIDRVVVAVVSVDPSERLIDDLSEVEEVYEAELQDRSFDISSGSGDSDLSVTSRSAILLKRVFKGIPDEGFLSISMIGDITLINRQRTALKKLYSNDGCYAPYLAGYLFDINSAVLPREIEEISTWYNKDLNDDQKMAVRKMISAPNICLIQGPPGTGKTTVIAEAIMQLAARNNRVLLASQSHDALDNALSRLQSNPQLQPIRLARFNDKITEDGAGFSGARALGRQYQSISEALHSRALNRYDVLKNTVTDLEDWMHDFSYLIAELERAHQSARSNAEQIQIQQRNSNAASLNLRRQKTIDDRIDKISMVRDFFTAVKTVCKASEGSDALLLSDELQKNMNADIEIANIAWPDDEQMVKSGEGFFALEQLSDLLAQPLPASREDYHSHEEGRSSIIAALYSRWYSLNECLAAMKMDLDDYKEQAARSSSSSTASEEVMSRLSSRISELREQLAHDDDADGSLTAELKDLNTRLNRMRIGAGQSNGTSFRFGNYASCFPDYREISSSDDVEQVKNWVLGRCELIVSINRAVAQSMAAGIDASALAKEKLLESRRLLDEAIGSAQKAEQELDRLNTLQQRYENSAQAWLTAQYEKQQKLKDIYLGLPELRQSFEARINAAASVDAAYAARVSTGIAMPAFTFGVISCLTEDVSQAFAGADLDAAAEGAAASGAARSGQQGPKTVLMREGQRWLLDVDQLKKLLNDQNSVLERVRQMLTDFESSHGDRLPLYRRMADILENPEERAEQDWASIGESYIKTCNVVAISCNENEQTLTSNGFDGFDVVIIDEVSKATPLEMLQPLMKAGRAVLVGDHRQLPPVFNEADCVTFTDLVEKRQAENEDGEEGQVNKNSESDFTEENLRKYKNLVTASLFKDLFENSPDVLRHRLNVQFRMHPTIMNMINNFYDGALKCGNPGLNRDHGLSFTTPYGTEVMSEKNHVLWVDTTFDEYGDNYARRNRDAPGNVNEVEAALIARTLVDIERQCLLKGYGPARRLKVGVVSFYQPQCKAIRNALSRITGRRGKWFKAIDVDINTVIRFQGKEKPVIILSIVKNNGGPISQSLRPGGAYIDRFEFINVAMSRAQNLLIVFGARNMLENREVKLPRMDSAGTDRVRVYQRMFHYLEYNRQDGVVTTAADFVKALRNPDGSAIDLSKQASAAPKAGSYGRDQSYSSGRGKGWSDSRGWSDGKVRSWSDGKGRSGLSGKSKAKNRFKE
ncbi:MULTISPECIES: AAA domain-containing protein [unclassified Anaerobiospirillum]|uniref:DEAD/DEAH box helicase n=1 Tax=unclassified Anaerobiospirillum TaxID=2647410 RepID=UPI001FF0E8CF|nr:MULTISPECIES: AAA domain-containing protein [unclassified Anaerobiospirillum]MCK0533946.1 AAA domain-containing protein [Anaerobiospirillum sp. NML120511]MCK0539149.1 AAA domain-containing protein [Anaerobiospirillum sp. NML02-A-032]